MNLIFKIFLALVTVHLGVQRAGANPNHQQLDAAFPVHGKEFSGELHKKAVEFYEPAKRKLFDFIEKDSKGDLQKIRAEDLGEANVLLMRLKRAAEHLQYLGEPAGRDFDLRAAKMHERVSVLIERSRSFPATQKYVGAFRQFITKTEAARAKAVVDLKKLIAQEKWEQAEADLFKIYDRLGLGTPFLNVPEIQAIYQPFSESESMIKVAMTNIRATKAKEILEKATNDLTPRYPALIEEMNAAVTALNGAPMTTWRGEQVAGVQLVEKLGQLWRETQVSALQARAKYWALQHRRNAYGMAMGAVPTVGLNLADDKFAKDFGAFSKEIVGVLTRIVEADSARVDASSLPQLYVAYLRAFSPFSREANSSEMTAAFRESLEKMAAKDAAFREQVAAYDATTRDLLRWRARAASSRAARMGSEYMVLEKRFREGTLSDNTYVGLFSPTAPDDVPQLNASAPDVMKTAVERLMGTKVTVHDAVRLPGESKAAIVRYDSRTYANVPLTFDVSAEIEALKADLFVTEQSPPLTLLAMQAITTAERGDMAAVGGNVAGVYLESVIGRFGTLPASAAVLTTLGQLPAERMEGSGLSQMLMRFNVTPAWVQHDYFVALTAPPQNLTAQR